jgi:hypothetical protein
MTPEVRAFYEAAGFTVEEPEVLTWERVGILNIDAGLVWIGDPRYVLHRSAEESIIGQSWKEFCDITLAGKTVFGEVVENGVNGGLCLDTGGDRQLLVEALKNENGTIREIRILF